jgi:hypothetical protein
VQLPFNVTLASVVAPLTFSVVTLSVPVLVSPLTVGEVASTALPVPVVATLPSTPPLVVVTSPAVVSPVSVIAEEVRPPGTLALPALVTVNAAVL